MNTNTTDGLGNRVRFALKRAIPASVRRAVRRTQRVASYVPRQLIGTITSVDTAEPAVALTFDDGPHPVYTPQFLDALERHGARGTFFLLGRSAQRYPELVRRLVAGGHAIGNHSWNHPSFPAIGARARRHQIRACGRVLDGASPKLFRPPYGDQTLASRLDPLWLRWQVVAWSVAGVDWRGEDAEAIAGRILEGLRPGSIVLLHDALCRYEDARYEARTATLEALALVLAAASSRYRFVTVPELLRLGRPRRELWRQPGQPDYLATLKGGDDGDGARQTLSIEQ